MADDCLFCKIAAGVIPSTAVYSDDDVYAFRDIHPAAPTHVLIIPKKHIPKISDADPADAALIGKLMLAGNTIAAEEGLDGDGYRFVLNCGKSAGQEVFHVHLHMLGGRDFTWPPG